MSLNDTSTFYDLLEIPSNASPQDVREAYIRTKATYHRTNVALYSIVSQEEREDMLKKIEEAYFVLSHPERRRTYDEHTGILTHVDETFANPQSHSQPQTQNHSQSESKKIVSIDRGYKAKPPSKEEIPNEVMIASSTDFVPIEPEKPKKQPSQQRSLPIRSGLENRSYYPKLDPSVVQEIEMEQEWRGQFLKKVREAYQISIEELTGMTKLSRAYILAIENEDFAKLPAPVYVRGFVSQIAKALKLSHEKVAKAYLARYVSVKHAD